MNIELYYDPVRPETSVSINGQRVSRSDIMGFLYPVRNCILQTWLPASGSWNGLRQQLWDLARGEELTVHFYGREMDFADLRGALDGMERLRLEFTPWDTREAYDGLFSQSGDLLRKLLTGKVSMTDQGDVLVEKSAVDLFPEAERALALLSRPEQRSWLRTVSTEDEFSEAVYSLDCCFVTEPYLSSFESLESLYRLTESMRRAADMVCCCVESSERRQEFEDYARQFPGTSFRFVEADGLWKQALAEKYGQPFLAREKLERQTEALKLLKRCFAQKDAVRNRSEQLKEELAANAANAPLLRERNICRYKLRWFRHEARKMEELEALLHRELAEKDLGGGGDA